MSSQHTPGPWTSRDVDEHDDADCGMWVVEIPETPGNTVIRLYFGDMENNEGEDIANADLVAAAPDLLAACQLVNRLMVLWADNQSAGSLSFEPFRIDRSQYHALLEPVRAAIAKAIEPKTTNDLLSNPS